MTTYAFTHNTTVSKKMLFNSVIIPNLPIKMTTSQLVMFEMFSFIIQDVTHISKKQFDQWFKYAWLYKKQKHIANLYMKRRKLQQYYCIMQFIVDNYDELYTIFQFSINM